MKPIETKYGEASGVKIINTKSMLKKIQRNSDKVWAICSLLPSLMAILVFVYGFIAWTGYVSLSNWNSFNPDLSWAGISNYLMLFQDFRFLSGMRNLIYFTGGFIIVCVILGLFLAILLDKNIKGETFFKNVFLFPLSLSLVVTGVVWMWLLNPETGVNLLLQELGFSNTPNWFISTNIVPSGIEIGPIQAGLPIALLSIIIAAVWQLVGFAMALYLAGLKGIPEEHIEAASVDGAGPFKTFWYVILPQLHPITISVVIIMIQISMKTFDLVYTMTGPGQGFVTDLPSLYMFSTTFQANQYAQGSGIAIVMFLLMSLVTIPYLYMSLRKEGGR